MRRIRRRSHVSRGRSERTSMRRCVGSRRGWPSGPPRRGPRRRRAARLRAQGVAAGARPALGLRPGRPRRPQPAGTDRRRVDVRETLEALQPRQRAAGGRVGLGDRGPDEGELQREPRRRGPAHVALRREQQLDDPSQLGGRELLGLDTQAFVARPAGCRGGPPGPAPSSRGADPGNAPASRSVTLRRSWPSWTRRLTISNALRASPTATASASSCCTSPRGAPSSACDRGVVHFQPAEHAGLVQQGKRVARGALGVPRDRVRRRSRSSVTPSDAATFCR